MLAGPAVASPNCLFHAWPNSSRRVGRSASPAQKDGMLALITCDAGAETT